MAGIDIGSLTTAVVILEKAEIVASALLPTGANGRLAAEKAMNLALKRSGRFVLQDINLIVTTGYGRVNPPYPSHQVTEISCHARGAVHLFPAARTAVDIGGQDCKVIRMNRQGRVIDFTMNDRCAAGTGRFLEVMASALELTLEELSSVGLGTHQAVPITSTCTVFAESEVVSLLASGVPREKIVRGIYEAVAERTLALISRVGVEPEVVMTGGVALNKGVVESLSRRLGLKLLIPDEPQLVGALGAALIAREKAGE